MTPQEIAWLQRCRSITEYLSALDTHEWAFEPVGGRGKLTTETGLELTIRQGQRITVHAWFGDMGQFAPRKITDHGYGWVSFCITEDGRKDDLVIARAILRRLLPRYRVAFAETSVRYAAHLEREAWEQETREAICKTFTGATRVSQGETVYLRGGKASVSATHGVHLDLHGLSRDQALYILSYLQETRNQRHTPQ